MIKSAVVLLFSVSLVGWQALGAGKAFNLRYNTADGIIGEMALGSFGLGLTANSVSASATSGADKATATAQQYGVRGSWYQNGMGTDSFYASGLVGSVSLKLEQDLLGTNLTGEATNTYFGAFAGYHWFWNYFNLNLGVGTMNWGISKISVKDSTGSTQIDYSNLPTGGSGIELGIGVAF